MGEIIALILVAMLGAGGPLVAWINTRSKDQPKITTEQAEAQALEKAVEDSGIADRWQTYADRIEARLNARIDRMEKDLDASRKAHRIALAYVGDLRLHIIQQLPPPPPDMPDGIHYP